MDLGKRVAAKHTHMLEHTRINVYSQCLSLNAFLAAVMHKFCNIAPRYARTPC